MYHQNLFFFGELIANLLCAVMVFWRPLWLVPLYLGARGFFSYYPLWGMVDLTDIIFSGSICFRGLIELIRNRKTCWTVILTNASEMKFLLFFQGAIVFSCTIFHLIVWKHMPWVYLLTQASIVWGLLLYVYILFFRSPSAEKDSFISIEGSSIVFMVLTLFLVPAGANWVHHGNPISRAMAGYDYRFLYTLEYFIPLLKTGVAVIWGWFALTTRAGYYYIILAAGFNWWLVQTISKTQRKSIIAFCILLQLPALFNMWASDYATMIIIYNAQAALAVIIAIYFVYKKSGWTPYSLRPVLVRLFVYVVALASINAFVIPSLRHGAFVNPIWERITINESVIDSNMNDGDDRALVHYRFERFIIAAKRCARDYWFSGVGDYKNLLLNENFRPRKNPNMNLLSGHSMLVDTWIMFGAIFGFLAILAYWVPLVIVGIVPLICTKYPPEPFAFLVLYFLTAFLLAGGGTWGNMPGDFLAVHFLAITILIRMILKYRKREHA